MGRGGCHQGYIRWVDSSVLRLESLIRKAPGSISAWAIYPWGQCHRNSAKGSIKHAAPDRLSQNERETVIES